MSINCKSVLSPSMYGAVKGMLTKQTTPPISMDTQDYSMYGIIDKITGEYRPYAHGDLCIWRGINLYCMYGHLNESTRAVTGGVNGPFDVSKWLRWTADEMLGDPTVDSQQAYFTGTHVATLNTTTFVPMTNFEFAWTTVMNSVPGDYGNIIVGEDTLGGQFGIRGHKTNKEIQIVKRAAGVPATSGTILTTFDVDLPELSSKFDENIRFRIRSRIDESSGSPVPYLDCYYSLVDERGSEILIESQVIDPTDYPDELPISYIGNNSESSRPAGKLSHVFIQGNGSLHYYPLAEGGTDLSFTADHPIYDCIGDAHGRIHGDTVWSAIRSTRSYPFNHGYDEVHGTVSTRSSYEPTIETNATITTSHTIIEFDIGDVSLETMAGVSVFTSTTALSSSDWDSRIYLEYVRNIVWGKIRGTIMGDFSRIPPRADALALWNAIGPTVRFEMEPNSTTSTNYDYKLYINDELYCTKLNFAKSPLGAELTNLFSSGARQGNNTQYVLNHIKIWQKDSAIDRSTDVPTIEILPINVANDGLSFTNSGSLGSAVTITVSHASDANANSKFIRTTLSSYRIPYKIDGTPQSHGLLPDSYTPRPFNWHGGNFPSDIKKVRRGPFIWQPRMEDFLYPVYTDASDVTATWTRLNP